MQALVERFDAVLSSVSAPSCRRREVLTLQEVALGFSEANVAVLETIPEPHGHQRPGELGTRAPGANFRFHMGPSPGPIP